MPGSDALREAPSRGLAPLLSRRACVVGLATTACAARLAPGPVAPAPANEAIRVLSLNLAHGRGTSVIHNPWRCAPWYRRNLAVIATLLRRERPDIVALQEAEFGSTWAGGFDHIARLARESGYPHRIGTAHVSVPGRRSYGTALLARVPIVRAKGVTFEHHGRWSKGFTMGHLDLPGGPVLVASVHLDHASASIRRAQVDEILAEVQRGGTQQIWMGDWNDAGQDRRSAIDRLQYYSALQPAFVPTRPTHPVRGRTLDWIFVSPALRSIDGRILPDAVSDHRALVADIVPTSEKKCDPLVNFEVDCGS